MIRNSLLDTTTTATTTTTTTAYIRCRSNQCGHSPGKPGKVRENKNSQGNVLACTKFGQLVLTKIIEIVATTCPIFRLKCTKFDFGCGSLQHSPGPLAGFKGAYF